MVLESWRKSSNTVSAGSQVMDKERRGQAEARVRLMRLGLVSFGALTMTVDPCCKKHRVLLIH